MRDKEHQRPLLGQRATSAFVLLLGLLALAVVALGIWLTLRGDTQLWYGDVPIP